MSYVCTSYLLSWRMIVVIKSKLWRTRVMYGLGYVSLVCYDTRYAPGTEKGCCVGRTCRHSEAAGGRVEVESRSCFLGVLQQKHFQTSVWTSRSLYTEEHYIIRIQTYKLIYVLQHAIRRTEILTHT